MDLIWAKTTQSLSIFSVKPRFYKVGEWNGVTNVQRKFLRSNSRNNANNNSRPSEIKTIKAQIAQLQIEAVVCSVEYIYDKSKGTPQRRIRFKFRFPCRCMCAITNALMIKSNNGREASQTTEVITVFTQAFSGSDAIRAFGHTSSVKHIDVDDQKIRTSLF